MGHQGVLCSLYYGRARSSSVGVFLQRVVVVGLVLRVRKLTLQVEVVEFVWGDLGLLCCGALQMCIHHTTPVLGSGGG